MPSAAVQHLARYRFAGAEHHGYHADGMFRRLDAVPWDGGRETGDEDPAPLVTLLPPMRPTKIICVGLNYREHIADSATVVSGAGVPDEPLIFLKPPSAAIGGGEAIRYPA